jgi:hypothetical protein
VVIIDRIYIDIYRLTSPNIWVMVIGDGEVKAEDLALGRLGRRLTSTRKETKTLLNI